MQQVRFLSVDNVFRIHEETIACEGGAGGIRDLGLLTSAVAMPRQRFGGKYLHPDLSAMAAAYLYHLCVNHPFVDGNKRVAAITSLIFLAENGVPLEVDEDVLYETVMAVAAGRLSKSVLTDWFRRQTGQG